MIYAYPDRPSVLPGQALTLHVATDAPCFRVDFYRQGKGLVLMACSGWQRGQPLAPGRPDQDWGWPSYTFPIPAEWPSGAYIALLREGDATGARAPRPEPATADGRGARALFVVRGAAPGVTSRVLYKLSWATYHAYNASGGGSLYVTPALVPNTARSRVTTRRPGGGTGGDLSFPTNVDVYDPASPREGFAHWDVPFIGWLEQHGYVVDYCTDLDLHRDADLLPAYSLLLSVGHDEYWSDAMRTHVEDFVRGGGNVAFFSGNTCWWRIHFADDDTAFECEHPPATRPGTDEWWRVRPENTLTGVSYRNAGGWWSGEREPLGFTVQHADHWLYEGTGLRDGDQFGAPERLVGYECDGALFEQVQPGLVVPTGADGTPDAFAILGVARLGPDWQDRPLGNNAAATLGTYSAGGTVFTCATTDWARVLHQGEPRVGRITHNVLTRLSTRGVRINGPFPARWGGQVVVEQEEAQLQVDCSALSTDDDRRYEWRVLVGDPVATAGPTFRARMPDGPGLVTVTVLVTDGAGRDVAFGSRTFRVLSRPEAAQVALLERLRETLQAAVPALRATVEVGPGNRRVCDPRWDPVRDGLRAPLSQDSLEAALSAGERLVEAVRDLLALRQSERP